MTGTGEAGERGTLDLTGSGAEPLRDRDPRRIGEIALVGRLGSGGMGRVYLGVVDGRFAAVKQMLASVVAEDRGFVRRFGQELDNLARLPEDATAPLLAGDRDAEPPWFATAYVPGITLAEAVERHGGPLDGRGLWSLLRTAAKGLTAVHALDMVHRDLKPSNVMLTADGVTLIDFGIARAAEQSQLTQTGLVVGTPAYMSPEQASGSRRLTGASDVFALGLLVAYAAGGRWPFGDGGEGSPLYRIVHDEPDLGPVRERDPELAGIVASCLDKDPEGRPTAAELVELAGTAGGSGTADGVWPGPVMELLAERAEFAARVPEGTPAPPSEAGGTAESTGSPEPQEPAEKPRERRRRTRVFLAVVPVVVVAAGTTLAIRNLPYEGGGAEAATTPSAQVSATAGPAGDRDPGGSASPSAKASKKGEAKDRSKDKGKGADQGSGEPKDTSGGSSGAAGGAGSGGGAEAGGGGSDTTGDGSGGGSSGGGSASGGGSSGSSGAGGGTPPDSGSYRLKNGDTGTCLVRSSGPTVALGACSGADATWKLVSNGGSFKLYNATLSMCLTNSYDGQNLTVAGCDLGIVWNWGANGSLRSTKTGGCIDTVGYGDGLTTAACFGGARQKWVRL
ncbi:protein kinase [Streptomyces sp. KL116D]|uniref:serine/threonine-protein kinase n=1 Tax=Streptomyces sp. KL116D TaxID=3045152 RepID=UPI0035567688